MRAAYQKGGYPDTRWQIELVPGRFACEPECSGVCARDKDADGAYAEVEAKAMLPVLQPWRIVSQMSGRRHQNPLAGEVSRDGIGEAEFIQMAKTTWYSFAARYKAKTWFRRYWVSVSPQRMGVVAEDASRVIGSLWATKARGDRCDADACAGWAVAAHPGRGFDDDQGGNRVRARGWSGRGGRGCSRCSRDERSRWGGASAGSGGGAGSDPLRTVSGSHAAVTWNNV